MAYFIPRGTPVEIQEGQRVHSTITSQDLYFVEAVIDKPNEMLFTDGRVYVLVAKALVIGRSPESKDDAPATLERVRPTSAEQISSL